MSAGDAGVELGLAHGAVLAIAAPALAALVLGLDLLLRPGAAVVGGAKAPRERFSVAVTQGSLGASLAGALLAAVGLARRGGLPVELPFGAWFRAGSYGFALELRGDLYSVVMSLLAAVLLLATARFSATYLHREQGFRRYFLLINAFAAGQQTLATAGSYDLFVAGWELVGLTSVLLVGFFSHRAAVARASLRVLVTYRLGDGGLLLAALVLHERAHSTSFATVHAALPSETAGLATSTLLGLALLLAAMAKSALFPLGGWLPRAMEGPTASSAVFYGALSLHAGVYLLLRAAPLYERSPIVLAALVLVGALSAVTATLGSKVAADAKSSLAYATSAQVGVMVALLGLGARRLVLALLVAHTLLRFYQFLRTPSALQDALARRALLAGLPPSRADAPWLTALFGPRGARWVYRLALEHFAVEEAFEAWLARPLGVLSDRLDALERRRAGLAPSSTRAELADALRSDEAGER